MGSMHKISSNSFLRLLTSLKKQGKIYIVYTLLRTSLRYTSKYCKIVSTPKCYCKTQKTMNARNILGMLCYDQSHWRSGHASKPQNRKLIIVAAYSLATCMYLMSDWLLPLDTITFLKYFQCLQFSEFDSNI